MVTTEAQTATVQETEIDPYRLPAPFRLKLPTDWALSDEALIALSDLNEPWQLELTANGELVVMAPEGPESSERASEIGTDVGLWNRLARGGHVFGAQLGVRNYDDGSLRAPDVAWMSNERWDQRDPERGFLSNCPEFIVEVVSPSSSFRQQREKMLEWMSEGALLGWLVDPFREIVVIYRPDTEPEQLDRPDTLSGEDVCEGLEVNLERIWK
ncbi:MAG: Uma2 family endonuclease [Chloroflexota bacterium]|nr:Uma2 family endonuclease [Chloroflexota bacterium]